MQPDEIIQHKEWYMLNPAEREAIAGLADNEQAYNLLKKMLMISAEKDTNVPVIGLQVKEKVAEHLPVKRTRVVPWYWYAASAAAVLLMVLLVIPKNKPADQDGYVRTEKTVPAKPQAILPAETTRVSPVIHDSAVAVIQPVKKLRPVQPKIKKIMIDPVQDVTPVYGYRQTTVADEKELLNLVTEID